MTRPVDNSQPRPHARRAGLTIVNAAGAIAAVTVLGLWLIPALGGVARSSKNGKCLANLMRIGYANAIYASQDATDMALPVHWWQTNQCCWDPGGSPCGEPFYIGAYEWGGKSGIGQTSNILFPGSEDPLGSKYGTKAGVGPAGRPLNAILYPDSFTDFGGTRPVCGFDSFDEVGASADTTLDLEINRCPADTGYTGIHCPDFADRKLSSYDHYGTSYNANLFMTASISVFSEMFSNSPYMHRMSEIVAPSTTLAYQENNGRFAWTAAPDRCDFIPGIPGPVRGWHGKDWTFNAAYIDGHAGAMYMRGYNNPDIGRYPEGASYGGFRCIIIRGEGWQIDTLPLPRVPTGVSHDGSGRPSYESCLESAQMGSSVGKRGAVSKSVGARDATDDASCRTVH